jgi:rare lipoprotein A
MAMEAGGRIRAAAPIMMLAVLLAGCGSGLQTGDYGANHYAAGHPMYRVGEPYRIKGIWYYPAVDYDYDRTGTASWYGEAFEGRYTANGEIFDLNQLTAAHTTLPMPSIVEVTNLDNGRSLQLRVNDRGPFVDGRLIDVSRRAAQLLGFETRGTTPVRVRVLKDESIAAADELMHGSGRVMVAEASAAAASATMAGPPPGYSREPARPRGPRPAAAPAAAPGSIQSPPPPPPIAVARLETPAPQPGPGPASPGAAHAAPSRFALIAPAEAAELPPARASVRAPKTFAAPAVPQMPPSSPRIAAVTSPRIAAVAAPRMAAAAQGSAGRIFVQAGAFSMRDNAQRVEARIASLGMVRVMTASVNGIEVYRVRLGPLDSVEQADRLLSRVLDTGYPGARIVTD